MADFTLLSSGYSVRPRPLDLWLSSLLLDEPHSFKDYLAKSNQISLISYLNGNFDLAEDICHRSMQQVVEEKEENHFLIQPWVNLGRIKCQSDSSYRHCFHLPLYALGKCLSPKTSPIKNWGSYKNNTSMMRFFWAVFITENAKLIINKKLPMEGFLDEITSNQEFFPEEFNFSILELKFYISFNDCYAGDFLKEYSDKLFNATTKSYKHQLIKLYLESIYHFSNDNPEEAKNCSVTVFYHIQNYKNWETIDPFLSIGFAICRNLFSFGLVDLALPLTKWINNTAYELNHEIMTHKSFLLLDQYGLGDTSYCYVGESTHYAALGGQSGSLLEKIEEASNRLHEGRQN